MEITKSLRHAFAFLILIALAATSTAALSEQITPNEKPDPLEPEVLHGNTQVMINDRAQMVVALDRMRSSYFPPDGYVEFVAVFAPIDPQDLNPLQDISGQLVTKTTIEKNQNSLRITFPGHGSYEFAIPTEKVSINDKNRKEGDPIYGLALSRFDRRAKQMDFEETMEEYSAFSAIKLSSSRAGDKKPGEVSGKSIDCTSGGPGARSCSVSCPFDLGGCSVTCPLELGYYACCSCYTGCGCKKDDTHIE